MDDAPGTGMQRRRRLARLRSARVIATVGIVVGVALTVGLAATVLRDRNARIEAAREQATALVAGADRLLHFWVRNLERALGGLAADADDFAATAPEQASALVAQSIRGVLSRHAELHSIALHDSAGRSVTGGADDPTLPGWADGNRLAFGPLQHAGDGEWVMPIALRTRNGSWMVARLRASEMRRMIEPVETGPGGSIGILDPRGTVLARAGDTDVYTGRRVPVPAEGEPGNAGSVILVSELDNVERIAAFSAKSGYPLVVGAGISLEQALAPWRTYALTAAALGLLYWFGLAFLVRRIRSSERKEARMLEELEANADWLDQAQVAAKTGVWRIEAHSDEPSFTRISRHAAEIFEFDPELGVVPIEWFFDRMHPEDRGRIEAEFAEARSDGKPFVLDYRIVLPSGARKWLNVRGSISVDAGGQQHIAGTIVDVTDRHEAAQKLAKAEDQFRELFERNPLPFWVFDTETLRFLAVNDAAVFSYGYSRAEFLAMSILDIRPRSEVDPLRAAIAERPAHETVDSVWTHLTRDGRRFEVRVHSSAIEFAGRPARLVLAEDVSERLSYERELAWRADHDATTGLLTLPALVARLDARPAGEDYLVAYVRLRDLELVAPMFGGDATDTILREAAGRFAAIGASYGHAAYKPGEAFVVVAVDGRERDRATMIEELQSATGAPVTSQVGTHALEAWVGLAHGRSGGADGPETVIGHAALAALRAQQENQHTMDYTPVLSEIAGLRLDLVARVRRALARGEFELFFQPIRRLPSRQIATFEALLRWRQADGSYVPPMHFIPLCEESGLILQVGA